MTALFAKSRAISLETVLIMPIEETTSVEEEISREETTETEIDTEEDLEREETDLLTEEEILETEETIVTGMIVEIEGTIEEITEEVIWKEEDQEARSATIVTIWDILPRIALSQTEEDLIVTREDSDHPEEVDVWISEQEDHLFAITAIRRVILLRTARSQERREIIIKKSPDHLDQALNLPNLLAPEAEAATKVETRSLTAIKNLAAPALAPAASKINRNKTPEDNPRRV